MVIMCKSRRWSRFGIDHWFDHKAGVSYRVDDEIWFDNHVVLIYQGVAMASVNKGDFWDLVRDQIPKLGYT
jgi:hypothetical protein